MGQRALCCCPPLSSSSTPSFHPSRLTQPLQLPAPPAALLAPPSCPSSRSSDTSAQLAAFVRSSPLASRLPPAVLTAVYERALYLYHLPADRLAWKEYHTPPSTTSLPPPPTPAVYYSSLHTAHTTWHPPLHYTPLTQLDYALQPIPPTGWFAALTARTAALSLRLTFHDDRTPLTDSYYGRLITARSPSLPHLLYTLPLLDAVLSSYPRSLYERLGLDCVVVCERLRYKGAEWRCVPVLKAGRLYVSCERVDAVYLQSTLHHELFHFIDHSMQATAPTPIPATNPPTPSQPLRNHIAHPDPDWCALNAPHFAYGHGGLTVRDASATAAASSPCVGLLNAYAASAVEEDRAEVWAALMRDVKWVVGSAGGGSGVGEADEIVVKKAALLRDRVELWSERDLGAQWWEGVAERAFSREARQRKDAMKGKLSALASIEIITH